MERTMQPSLFTTLRVNTLKITSQEALSQLQEELTERCSEQFIPTLHAVLPGVIIIKGYGPVELDFSDLDHKLIVVTKRTGESVMRGAEVYAPGILATSPGIEAGDAVIVAIQMTDEAITRGTVLRPDSNSMFFIGIGISEMSRKEIFRRRSGLAVRMRQTIFELPPCNGLLQGMAMIQNLPSIVAAHVVNPQPGWKILDMCASPGGKTTAMAELMRDSGEIIALDRTNSKAAAIKSLSDELGLKCITVYRMDATKAARVIDHSPVQRELSSKELARMKRKQLNRERCKQEPLTETCMIDRGIGFSRSSFDAVLLDAPCSALGLRPRLSFPQTLEELEETAVYQRCLLETAVKLVKPGGVLVYSTCTINPGENEANVRFVLDNFLEFQLETQQPYMGEAGFVGEKYLTEDEAKLVQRFYPDSSLDTIGFFIAKFRRAEALTDS